ncbi:ArsR family transcriptional regulator [Halobellus limi]|uniref:ArsR family transcriptional regulator n=1 Tax=Halobellus limi TaxID=699433 RepID=A0A1H5UMT1_9EURY|nr:ArsR family transcriptional regulator [Halobellus limi]SEF76383.1 transcriptional regulator, ArsR family [Halobellus limi]
MDSAVLLDLLGNENRRRILRLLSHKPCYVTEISEYLGVSPKAVIDHLRRLEEAGLVESRTDDQRRKYFHIARNLRLEVSVSPYRFGAKSAYPASRSLDMRGRCQHISLDIPGSNGRARVDDLDAEDRDGKRGDVEGDGSDGGDESQGARGRIDPCRNAETDGQAGDSDTADSNVDAPDTDDPAVDDPDDVAELARQYAYLEDVESELSLAQRWVHGRVTDVLDSLSERVGAEADSRFYAELLATIAHEPKSAREVARELNANPERVETALDRLSDQELVEYDGSGWRIV